jgi:hypothetical protein
MLTTAKLSHPSHHGGPPFDVVLARHGPSTALAGFHVPHGLHFEPMTISNNFHHTWNFLIPKYQPISGRDPIVHYQLSILLPPFWHKRRKSRTFRLRLFFKHETLVNIGQNACQRSICQACFLNDALQTQRRVGSRPYLEKRISLVRALRTSRNPKLIRVSDILIGFLEEALKEAQKQDAHHAAGIY